MKHEAAPRPDPGLGLTHASFFSGVGGLDIGLERAGWRTVVFHEIEPYASAVLARHWPDVPNGGCVYRALGAPAHGHDEHYQCIDADGIPIDWGDTLDDLRAHQGGHPAGPGRDDAGGSGRVGPGTSPARRRRRQQPGPDGPDWHGADLFTGGFPCQDLSIAGKRKGLGGHRSGLAYAFLTLVERHRPRALLLENVPGLLSSHRGRDLGALLRLMGELGYGVAYRVYDARFFGVPQRRKRIFILGLRCGDDDPDGRLAAERAAAVLAVGTRCPWHPPAGTKAGPVPAGGPRGGPERYGVEYVGSWQAGPHGFHGYDQASVQGHLPVISHALTTTHTRTGRLDPNGETFVVADRAAPDPGGDGAPDGLARRLDDRARLEGAAGRTANSVQASAGHHGHSSPRGDGSDNLVHAFVKSQRARERDGEEKWVEDDVAPTLNTFDTGDSRAVTLVQQTQESLSLLSKPNSSHAADLDTYIVAATLNSGGNDGGFRTEPGEHLTLAPTAEYDDPLLPEGLDSHRYRCCGNGVVSTVAEWIGARLYAALS